MQHCHCTLPRLMDTHLHQDSTLCSRIFREHNEREGDWIIRRLCERCIVGWYWGSLGFRCSGSNSRNVGYMCVVGYTLVRVIECRTGMEGFLWGSRDVKSRDLDSVRIVACLVEEEEGDSEDYAGDDEGCLPEVKRTTSDVSPAGFPQGRRGCVRIYMVVVRDTLVISRRHRQD